MKDKLFYFKIVDIFSSILDNELRNANIKFTTNKSGTGSESRYFKISIGNKWFDIRISCHKNEETDCDLDVFLYPFSFESFNSKEILKEIESIFNFIGYTSYFSYLDYSVRIGKDLKDKEYETA